jgi:hypothetical protein
MTDFPWGVSIGLGIVLLGTLSFIIYIFKLDTIEQCTNTKSTKSTEL